MTTVNVTKELLANVTATINRLRDAEIGDTATKLNTQITKDTDIGALMTTKLWEDYGVSDLRDRLEKYNLNGSHIYLNTPYKPANPEAKPRVAKIFKAVVRPCVASNAEHVTLTVEDHTLIKEYIDALIIKEEAVERWNGVKLQITSFLESCKTVNKALKLWPDVQRYIPKEYITRVNAVTEKAASSHNTALDALKNINMDAVTTSTVLARMAGATI